jgi:hypothetical protein
VIATLLLDRASDYLAWRFGWFQRWTQSVPAILVENAAHFLTCSASST